MSKRNKPNRFTNIPDFRESRRASTENDVASAASPKSNVVIFEETDDDEDFSYFNYHKIGLFFGGCWNKLASFSKSAVSKTWGWCCVTALWTWDGLRKISSYCVINWDSEDEDELTDSNKKPEPDKTSVKLENKVATVPVNAHYDENDLASSQWWNIGIKTVAITVAALILVGGYFAVKPLLLTTSTEVMDVATASAQAAADLRATVSATAEFGVANDSHISNAEYRMPLPIDQLPAESLEPPKQPDMAKQPDVALAEPKQELNPQQSLLDDPFFSSQTPPAVAESVFVENVPKIADDPFDAILPVVAEQPVPVAETVASETIAKSESIQPLTALKPFVSLDPVPITKAEQQLQPLVALDSSAFPATAVAPVTDTVTPVAAESSVYAKTASNYNSRRTSRGTTMNPLFDQAPTPPTIESTIPQTIVKQTIPITEPVREIVPQIPHTGTVQNVPPPVVSPTPAVAMSAIVEAPLVRPMYSESVPAIPKDAAPVATVSPVVSVSVPIEEPSPQNLPMDSQLWDQIRELRKDSETEPTNLRFSVATTAEPALRFTPKRQTPPSVNEDNVVAKAANTLRDLLPTDGLNPNSGELESFLPALENAPAPAISEIRPAYRSDSMNHTERERGLTFRNRIDLATTRSPSETETYIVQHGDTYLTISDKFYGTSLLYTALAAHNQKLGFGWRLAEGATIEIPTAEYLQTLYGDAANRAERRLESQQSAIRYIVQEGDTIFRLATDKLQDSTRWREIYAINKDRIPDVRDLKPGMEILLPVVTARLNRQQTH